MYDKLKKIDRLLFGKLHDHYPIKLQELMKDCDSVLDVGCGAYSPIKYFSKTKKCTGVDAYLPSIERSKELGIHNEYRQINILDIDKEFAEGSFDCVIASDVIEHLTKEDGIRLMKMMEKVAAKKVIIFTPNGFLHQTAYDNNELQEHLSGWEVDEMKKYGYKVTGINGLKFLKGEFAEVKWEPKELWGRISLITQIFTEYIPKRSFAILCVKNINRKK